MIKILYKDVKSQKLETLSKFQGGSFVYAENPSETDLDNLAKNFNLDRGHLSDAIDPYEIPRLEEEEELLYVFIQYPHKDGNKIKTVPAAFIIGNDFIITISKKIFPFIEKFKGDKIDFFTTQKTKLFLQLFLQINDQYDFYIKDIMRQVRTMRVKIENISNKEIMKFVALEETLNEFLSVLIPTSTILQNLLSGKHLKLFHEDKDLVEDLILSNDQLIKISKSNLLNMVNIREAYSTIMTNNLNRVIKLFTSLTIILTIPTIISSIYGMNVRLPFDKSPVAFFGIIGLIVLISISLLCLFSKKKWL